jgi:hypothetical protein
MLEASVTAHELVNIDIFVAFTLASILLQGLTCLNGYKNINRIKDREWKLAWVVFILCMAGITIRRIVFFNVFAMESILNVKGYYSFLFENLFQLLLSVGYLWFSKIFYHMKIGVSDAD